MIRKLLYRILLIILLPASIFAGEVKLMWDPNTEDDLSGYKVYYGQSPGVYGNSIVVGRTLAYTVKGLIEGVTYYLAVTAYDTSNNESGYSNEIHGVAAASPPGAECPGGPYSFYISGIGGGWVSHSPACGSYAEGQTILLKPVPNNTSFKFDHWSGDSSGSNVPLSWTFVGAKFVLSFVGNFIPIGTPVVIPIIPKGLQMRTYDKN